MTRRSAVLSMLVALLVAAGAIVVLLGSARPQTALPAVEPFAGTPRPEPSGARVLLGAGDIADCNSNGDEATARLVAGIGGTVFTAGDNAYPNGSERSYLECYEPSWGMFRDRTRPVPGNHEYDQTEAAPYFEYFGEAAGAPTEGWYAYDLGSWRIYALNSNCQRVGGCERNGPQATWLAADLAAHPAECVVAYWHHPLIASSSRSAGYSFVKPLWGILHEAGAELVVTAHEHIYERFGPLDSEGLPAQEGMRAFIVGTGGDSLYSLREPQPGSEMREAQAHGILELTLRDGGYGWRFVAIEGSSFSDEGSGSCR
ncbi:MAG: metallophosphoesterase [Chloroflexi bacterium]|nr:metallophosphoesterase [Chloroflexota bacterium]HEV8054227.1 metallophosphoesterase [Candidatus Limnocylindrales bacterium]